jgi:alcohol dehydrogenase
MSLDEVRSLLGPTVTYGVGAVTELPAAVAALKARRTLLVCGRRSFEASGAAVVLPHLTQLGEVERWDDFRANTDADDLVGGLDVLRRFEPDLILGVGGGSAMDMAKLLAAYATTRDDVREVIAAGARIDARGPQLVLVPTTSGSGSEATHFAVVYVGQQKHSVAGPAMRPDRVVLDPQLSRSGSPYQRATSGIDAVCQAIESLWAVGATNDSRRFARAALGLLLDDLEAFVHDPSDDNAGPVCLGSHLAGRAIDISRTTAAHALSYGFTKRHGISHGHAAALTLGPFIEAHAAAGADDLQPGRDAADHGALMREILTLLGATDGPSAAERFRSFMDRLGLEPSLRRLGIADDLEALARGVNLERLSNNPVVFDARGLRSVLRRAC